VQSDLERRVARLERMLAEILRKLDQLETTNAENSTAAQSG
jgi:uncharacterized protein YceH (UPF0502 family)